MANQSQVEFDDSLFEFLWHVTKRNGEKHKCPSEEHSLAVATTPGAYHDKNLTRMQYASFAIFLVEKMQRNGDSIVYLVRSNLHSEASFLFNVGISIPDHSCKLESQCALTLQDSVLGQLLGRRDTVKNRIITKLLRASLNAYPLISGWTTYSITEP